MDEQVLSTGWRLYDRDVDRLALVNPDAEVKGIRNVTREITRWYVEVPPLPQGVMLVRGMTNVGLTVEYKREAK